MLKQTTVVLLGCCCRCLCAGSTCMAAVAIGDWGLRYSRRTNPVTQLQWHPKRLPRPSNSGYKLSCRQIEAPPFIVRHGRCQISVFAEFSDDFAAFSDGYCCINIRLHTSPLLTNKFKIQAVDDNRHLIALKLQLQLRKS